MKRHCFWAGASALLMSNILFTAPTTGADDLQPMAPLLRVHARIPKEGPPNLEGFVVFEVVVAPDGSVKDARPIEAEPPNDVFKAAAVKALLKWRFLPRFSDGKAIEYTGRQRYDFRKAQALTPEQEACEAKRSRKGRLPNITPEFSRRHVEAFRFHYVEDYAKAIEVLNGALEIAKSSLEKSGAYSALGANLVRIGRYGEAQAALEAALAAKGFDWQPAARDRIIFELAELHAVAGRFDEAQKLLDRYFSEACAPLDWARELRATLAEVRGGPDAAAPNR